MAEAQLRWISDQLGEYARDAGEAGDAYSAFVAKMNKASEATCEQVRPFKREYNAVRDAAKAVACGYKSSEPSIINQVLFNRPVCDEKDFPGACGLLDDIAALACAAVSVPLEEQCKAKLKDCSKEAGCINNIMASQNWKTCEQASAALCDKKFYETNFSNMPYKHIVQSRLCKNRKKHCAMGESKAQQQQPRSSSLHEFLGNGFY